MVVSCTLGRPRRRGRRGDIDLTILSASPPRSEFSCPARAAAFRAVTIRAPSGALAAQENPSPARPRHGTPICVVVAARHGSSYVTAPAYFAEHDSGSPEDDLRQGRRSQPTRACQPHFARALLPSAAGARYQGADQQTVAALTARRHILRVRPCSSDCSTTQRSVTRNSRPIRNLRSDDDVRAPQSPELTAHNSRLCFAASSDSRPLAGC